MRSPSEGAAGGMGCAAGANRVNARARQVKRMSIRATKGIDPVLVTRTVAEVRGSRRGQIGNAVRLMCRQARRLSCKTPGKNARAVPFRGAGWQRWEKMEKQMNAATSRTFRGTDYPPCRN